MKNNLGRSSVISTCALIMSLVTACSAGGSDGANGGPAEGAIDNPDMSSLDGLSNVGLEEMLGEEKIRRGSVIDYDQQVGNGTVAIAAPVPQGIELCTAQVVNKWILLTAAHCVSAMFPNGTGDISVGFSERSGFVRAIYNGPVEAFTLPNWRRVDRDVAIIFLSNGLNTCQQSLSDCAASQPDIPVNSATQYFRPDLTPFTSTSYTVLGYGATDNGSTGAGVLRRGTMTTAASGFTDSNNGFSFAFQWSSILAQRSCPGDSGGPLVVPTSSIRPFHTGFGSQITNAGCTASSGTIFYSGLPENQAIWVVGSILTLRNSHSLVFDCSAPTLGNLSVFGCDNDGSVF
jgi:hypothetical protein